MKFPLVFVLLVLVPVNVLGKYVNTRDDLTYDDLVQTNVTCAYVHTCKVATADPFKQRTCNCDPDCSEFGFCCIDSDFRDALVPMVECRNVDLTFSKDGYFLVSRCPPEVGSESAWKDLCEKEWNGEDDMMKLAPVSTPFISYKNYYCYRCHEDRDKFQSWNMRIQSNFVDKDKISEDFSITYDKAKESWIATTGDDYVLDNIYFNFSPPGGLKVEPAMCKFALVSECDDSWTDEDTREKCRSYSAIVYSKYNESVSFRNPHCALCNFEPVGNIDCGLEAGILGGPLFGPKQGFSFTHLLNIHREDVEKSEKCEENQLWDPYAKKCRRLACAIPGYVVKGGRCTRP